MVKERLAVKYFTEKPLVIKSLLWDRKIQTGLWTIPSQINICIKKRSGQLMAKSEKEKG